MGFRPFVHATALRLGLTGWVRNDAHGVEIAAFGPAAALEILVATLKQSPPPLARVDAVTAAPCSPVAPEDVITFVIRDSAGGGRVTTAVTPDAAVCPACLEELFDPGGRRWRYPFLNCTHCGPRLTITRRLPYDRPQTSMAPFPLCALCAAEYHDPADRRFHAQPMACPACGPRLSLPVADVWTRLQAGDIVALKGLGGFHLVCDARNAAAVARLRVRKERDGKPFAVMVAGLASARRLAAVEQSEAALLMATPRPVVLLRRHPEAETAPALASDLAPGLAWLGVMLPYTPLHYLLFHEAAGRPAGTGWLEAPQDTALVMTSANPGGEPLVIANDEARQRLAGIADLVVDHDRDILTRVDDSVVRVVAGGPALVRRARGYVPQAIPLPLPSSREPPPLLAVGGHLKGAVCLTRGREAFLSQHLGDLDNAATLAFLDETVTHLCGILEVTPALVVHDLHPDYAATRWALAYARKRTLPVRAVQHHHAHLAAVAAEYGLPAGQPAVGLALDGVGLGPDGRAWGGEMLELRAGCFVRLGHLAPLPQPGGDAAARQPWRMAAAVLHALGRGDEIPRRFAHQGAAAAGVAEMLARNVRCPPTTGCGRWFDAAAALLGVCLDAGYEGEAPMRLESLVPQGGEALPVLSGGWRVTAAGELALWPLMAALAPAGGATLAPAYGAALFHGTLAAALVDWVVPVVAARNLSQVLLSGGCLINRVLAEALCRGLQHHGITPLIPRCAPPGDGGLALGQAWAVLGEAEGH